MILPRPSWSGFMSIVHKRTSSVQHICCPPSPHYHSWTWTCLTFHLKRQERWFWLRGNLLSFPASTFGWEYFTKFAFGQTQLWSRCSCVLENSRWCHSWAWHITVKSGWTCTIRLNLHNPFASLASSVVSERNGEVQRCPADGEGSSCSERTTSCRSKCDVRVKS